MHHFFRAIQNIFLGQFLCKLLSNTYITPQSLVSTTDNITTTL